MTFIKLYKYFHVAWTLQLMCFTLFTFSNGTEESEDINYESLIISAGKLLVDSDSASLNPDKYEAFTKYDRKPGAFFRAVNYPGVSFEIQRYPDLENSPSVVIVPKEEDGFHPSQTNTFLVFLKSSPNDTKKYTAHKAFVRYYLL